ncbi:MAG: DNA polymerase III subunit gamma/tau [Thermoleophilia bacterium]
MTALYRKYRPQTFDEVVGQEAVVRTLTNAIEQDRLRQAYLFSGPRGTGKTSLARILAKALNCERGPTTTPCGTCLSCVSIASGQSLDVIEMDAASQRGIDDVREIRERAILQPIARNKVYILDEAHQLTKDAFNALLKLIEEPPPHLVFVFCTTELDKMLATVRSRCQTFMFARPRLADLTKLLRRVADGEQMDVPDAALALVARGARGSFRDAVSTLDQLASATGGAITVQSVLQLLGAVEEEALFRLLDHVVDQDAAGALAFVEELADQGQDLARLVGDLLEHLRLLMLLQHLDELPEGVPVTDETRDRLRAQANQLGERQVIRLIDLLAVAIDDIRQGGDPRLPLELALVKVARPQADLSREALLLRLETLEARVAHGGTTAAAPAPAPRASSPARLAAVPAPAVTAAPAAPAVTGASGAPAVEEEDVEAPSAPPPPPAGAGPLDLATLQQLWRQAVLPAVGERSIPLGSVLSQARPVQLAEGRLVVEFPPSASFNRAIAEEPKNTAILVEAIHQVSGQRIGLAFAVSDPASAGDERGDDAHQHHGPMSEDELVLLLQETLDAHEVGDDN